MPPIVALTRGAALTSSVPLFSNPLPLMLYVTELSVTPGAT
jgi:hypothetical protein